MPDRRSNQLDIQGQRNNGIQCDISDVEELNVPALSVLDPFWQEGQYDQQRKGRRRKKKNPAEDENRRELVRSGSWG